MKINPEMTDFTYGRYYGQVQVPDCQFVTISFNCQPGKIIEGLSLSKNFPKALES